MTTPANPTPEPDGKFADLLLIAEGHYQVPRKWWEIFTVGGWLHVYRPTEGTVSVHWTSSKDTHQPLCGPSVAVDFDRFGNVVAYYRSALSLWLIWGYGRGTDADHQNALLEADWMAAKLRAINPPKQPRPPSHNAPPPCPDCKHQLRWGRELLICDNPNCPEKKVRTWQ